MKDFDTKVRRTGSPERGGGGREEHSEGEDGETASYRVAKVTRDHGADVIGMHRLRG